MSIQNEIDRITAEVSTQADLIARGIEILRTKTAGSGSSSADKTSFDVYLEGSSTELYSEAENVCDNAMSNYTSTAYGPPLTKLVLPNAKSIGIKAFAGLVNLSTIDLGSVTNIGADAFRDTSGIYIIIRSDTVPTLSNSAFSGTYLNYLEGDGYIYVPSSLVNSYKSATNWSEYADFIRAIEDYPDITGG